MPDREVYLKQEDYNWVDVNHKNITNTLRKQMINRLTLDDTATYRKKGLEINNKFQHEPVRFRLDLYHIYDSLTDKHLENLFNLRIMPDKFT